MSTKGYLIEVCTNGNIFAHETTSEEYWDLAKRLSNDSFFQEVKAKYKNKYYTAFVDEDAIMKGLEPNIEFTNMIHPNYLVATWVRGNAYIWVPSNV